MRIIVQILFLLLPFFLNAVEKFTTISQASPTCKKNLIKLMSSQQRFLYNLDLEGFYSADELARLKKIYGVGAELFKNEKREANSGKAVQLLNPIYLAIKMKINKTNRRSWRIDKTITSDAQALTKQDDYELLLRIAHRALDLIETNNPEFFETLEGRDFDVRFFGVRYFLLRGQRLQGVRWHRHGEYVAYQSLILLQKPKDLIGGAFLLAQGKNIKHVTTSKAGKKICWEFRRDKSHQWRFKLPTNYLLTFDGHYLGHATETFGLPQGLISKNDFRDVLGIEIYFPQLDVQ